MICLRKCLPQRYFDYCIFGKLFPFFLFLAFAGCSGPAERFNQHASFLGIQSEIVQGNNFSHAIYFLSSVKRPDEASDLHVYYGGDGTPIIASRPTVDPTPRKPLMLQLLALGPRPAVYIGRPCYHGLALTKGCVSELWTTARYSEAVVSSLVEVTRLVIKAGGYNKVFLYGYSGGGTLAMLVAERLPQVRAIVTVAANLDIDAWRTYHRSVSLMSSLSPVLRPRLPRRITQHHYAGSEDHIVPPALIKNASVRLGSKAIIIKNYDHVCCWAELWPKITAEISALHH